MQLYIASGPYTAHYLILAENFEEAELYANGMVQSDTWNIKRVGTASQYDPRPAGCLMVGRLFNPEDYSL